MKVVDQQLRHCAACQRQTLHMRNNKRMSWVMHLVLAIFTLGTWLILWGLVLVWHILTKPIAGRWTCSVCGTKEGHLPPMDRAMDKLNKAGEEALARSRRQAHAARERAQQERPPVQIAQQQASRKPSKQPATRVSRPAEPPRPLPVSATGDPEKCTCGRLVPFGMAQCPHCGALV